MSSTVPASWSPTLSGVRTVLHAAAIVSNTVSHDDAWRLNVLGTRRVQQAAAAAGARRFVGHGYPDTRVNSEAVVLAAASMMLLARPGGYSIDKARRVLGFEPRVGMDEGKATTEAWVRAEGLV